MNLHAERAVIGSILMDPDSIAKVSEDLRAEMFENEVYRQTYAEAVKSYAIGDPINLVSLAPRLHVENFGDDDVYQELRDCFESTVTSVEIVSYAKVLINEYKSREMYRLFNKFKAKPDDVDKQLGELMTELEALQQTGKHSKLKPFAEVVDEQEKEHFVDRPDIGIKFGMELLDDALVLLEPGDVMVIGARPAVGKSAFVTQIISTLSAEGKNGALYNLEMSEKQVYERMLSRMSGIELKRVRKAKAYLSDERKRVELANKELREYNMYLHSGPVKPSEIRSECKYLGLDYIVIDYLQLMQSDQWYPNRVNEVGAISKAVKAIAMDLKVPIILLSQLNRTSETRTTKEPELQDLRESGDIEQDASFVMFLWNMDEDDVTRKGSKLAKNRQGELVKVELSFDGARMTFSEVGGAGNFTQHHEATPFD